VRGLIISSGDLDTVLNILANPVRRSIIKRLSEDTSYPLELSGDLGIHQQLISKHLKVMEEADVVEATKESSPRGPDRRIYGLTKSVSLAIDFSPDLYGARITAFREISVASRNSEVGEFTERFDTLRSRKSRFRGISPFAELIADIDRNVETIEKKRTALLQFRSLVMHVAKENIRGKSISAHERSVIHHILNRNEKEIGDIARNLDLRKEVVTQIFAKLRASSILS